MKAVGRVLSWMGVVLFGSAVVGTLVAKLDGSYLGDNAVWIIQESIQGALFALSLWGVVSLRTVKPKEPTKQGAPPRLGLRAMHVIQGILVLAIVGILGSIGMSAMNDRVVKERFIEAFSAGESAAKFSQGYYVKNGKWPTQAEFPRQPFVAASSSVARGIKSISVADNGTIIVTMTGHAELNDKLIQLRPTVLQRDISWTCVSDYEQRGFPVFLNRRCDDQFPRK
jgi:Tfp pilus assembly protein PilE